MTDYSRLDETTLRAMLDASYDLEERQQLRSILRRLKKHSNTISFSPINRENIMNKNHNNALSIISRWEQTSGGRPPKSSSSPNSNEILPRRNTGLEKTVLSPIVNCNEALDKSKGEDCNGKTARCVLQVIRNCSRSQDSEGVGVKRNSCSFISEGNIVHRPVENFKQTLGKTFSEPIYIDGAKLARSRLVIQQLLAPRIAAVANQGYSQETAPPITALAPRMFTTANQGEAEETAPPITTLAPRMFTTANQGEAEETAPPITTLAPRMFTTANQGEAEETAPPITTLAPRMFTTANQGEAEETAPPITTLAPRMFTTANQGEAEETAPPITTLAPRMFTTANQGEAEETAPPITTLAPRMFTTANQGDAQETTPPITTLSVQDDHSRLPDAPINREPSTPSVVDNDIPIFTRTLCDISDATLGETVVLVCKVVARLRPMVLWYRNSQLIPVFSRRYEQSYDGDTARLTIRSVGYDVVGVYECAARNAFGKVTSTCHLQLKGDTERATDRATDRVEPSLPGQMATPPTHKVTLRRSETLPSSALVMRAISSAARRKMETEKPSLREDPLKRNEVGVASHPEEVEEEAVARSTRTEKASDGGKVTTTTTVTTHKTKDGAHLVTKQTKQITRVGGVGTTNYSINKCSAEEIAERLAGLFEKKALLGTGGVIVVKTENWNSQDGITHRNEKSQIWEAPRLALSFNEADLGSKYGDAGFNPLQRSATTVKQRCLEWCRITLKDYKNVSISNFSTSWNDGMAFCALVHHFIPDAFDYNQLDPKNRRHNFQLAFETAEKRAGIVPLLEVEDMVSMTVPDWKCVFMYVQSIYREFVLPKPLQQRSANNVDGDN